MSDQTSVNQRKTEECSETLDSRPLPIKKSVRNFEELPCVLDCFHTGRNFLNFFSCSDLYALSFLNDIKSLVQPIEE